MTILSQLVSVSVGFGLRDAVVLVVYLCTSFLLNYIKQYIQVLQ